jgi:putative DNA primase/helicase
MTVSNVAEFPSWRSALAVRKNGEPIPDERNVMLALEKAPELVGMLQYDAFADQIRMFRPPPWPPYLRMPVPQWTPKTWSDSDRIELQIWLQHQGLAVSRASVVQDAVIAVAQRSRFHPVEEYLTQVRQRWDGIARLDRWLIHYLGADDGHALRTKYLRWVGAKFLIGAVARIMVPGCQMDTILVLEGPQGLGKSSVVRVLFGDWCADVAHDMGGKDAAILIQGIWGGELSELTALAKSQVEATKAFISRRIDRYRPPYGRNAIDRPRQTVFIATTNECEYLQDPSGGRRFWPTDCRKIDLDALRQDRDQLWAEATQRFRDGEAWYLEHDAEALVFHEQEHRRLISPLETQVLAYTDRMRSEGQSRLDMRTILREALNVDTLEHGPTAGGIAKAVSRVLAANGWMRFRPTGRGANRVVNYEYAADRDPCQAEIPDD